MRNLCQFLSPLVSDGVVIQYHPPVDSGSKSNTMQDLRQLLRHFVSAAVAMPTCVAGSHVRRTRDTEKEMKFRNWPNFPLTQSHSKQALTARHECSRWHGQRTHGPRFRRSEGARNEKPTKNAQRSELGWPSPLVPQQSSSFRIQCATKASAESTAKATAVPDLKGDVRRRSRSNKLVESARHWCGDSRRHPRF